MVATKAPYGQLFILLIKRHNLNLVFAGLKNAISSFFNNMEISFGKEKHDILGGWVSYFILAVNWDSFSTLTLNL